MCVSVGFVVVTAILAYLNWLPPIVHTVPHLDKVLHFSMIGSLAFWFVLQWGDRRWQLGTLSLPLAVLAPGLLALADEALQALSPVRSASLADLAFDLAGLVFFWWLGRRWIESRKPSSSPLSP